MYLPGEDLVPVHSMPRHGVQGALGVLLFCQGFSRLLRLCQIRTQPTEFRKHFCVLRHLEE